MNTLKSSDIWLKRFGLLVGYILIATIVGIAVQVVTDKVTVGTASSVPAIYATSMSLLGGIILTLVTMEKTKFKRVDKFLLIILFLLCNLSGLLASIPIVRLLLPMLRT